MSEHTKGPWFLYINKGKALTLAIFDSSKSQSDPIVSWLGFDSCSKPDKEKIANAKLIASAPDMHDELTRLLAVEVAAKKLDEALEWVMKDYEDMCRKSLQQSANWKKRVVMAKASSKAFQRSINPIGERK